MTLQNTFEWQPADSLTEPLYIRQHSFLGDSLSYTGRGHDRLGVAGDPVPYTIRGDNFFTSLFLLSLIVIVVSLSRTRQFVLRQLKDLYYPANLSKEISATSGEVRVQSFLVLLACLLFAMSVYMYAKDFIAETYVVGDYELMGLFFGGFLAYFALKGILYILVNSVFFSGSQQEEWLRTALFLVAMEGVLLFPIVLLQIYFDLSFENAVYYYGFVFLLVKMLTFYKSWNIFFRQIGAYLQNFLYFCTLEIVPLLILSGIFGITVDILKITI